MQYFACACSDRASHEQSQIEKCFSPEKRNDFLARRPAVTTRGMIMSITVLKVCLAPVALNSEKHRPPHSVYSWMNACALHDMTQRNALRSCVALQYLQYNNGAMSV